MSFFYFRCMKIFYTFLLNFITCSSLLSQVNTPLEFIGALTTEDLRIISYKLMIDTIQNNKVTGVSTTDFYGKNITKSSIEGVLINSTLSFNEISNISTKYKDNADDFCYVHVENLKIRTSSDKKIINGKFIGRYASGDICAKGTIYLVHNDTALQQQIVKANEMITSRNNGLKQKTDSLLIRNKTKLSYTIAEKTIQFDVWDGNEEDNDIINIYYNGQIIEENLVIKNQKKTIEIPFTTNKAIIRIVAVSEGDASPNTVSFMLKNEENRKSFVSFLKEGESFTIEFNRK